MSRSIKPSLAGYVALAYTLVIAYASAQPFSGWRMPPPEVLAFLTAPWPRYITSTDISLNVAAYLPLGAMLFFVLRPRLSAAFALVLASLLAALLSLLLESVQMFLPARIASNVDLLTNTAGAAFGAMAALLLTSWRNPLAELRARLVRAGPLGDCGLIMLVLWIVIQFHPSSVAFGSGNVRDVFGFAPQFLHSSQAYLMGEAGVVALTVIAIGLGISLIMRTRLYTWRVIAAMLLLTAGAKSIAATTITRSMNPLQWLTPGVAVGLAIGAIAVWLFMRASATLRALAAIGALIAVVAVINVMPENPYQTLPAFLSTQPATHLANFSSIVRVLSECWPFAVMAWLFALLRAGPSREIH